MIIEKPLWDSKPYHPVYSRTFNREISNKNRAFYFMKRFMLEDKSCCRSAFRAHLVFGKPTLIQMVKLLNLSICSITLPV